VTLRCENEEAKCVLHVLKYARVGVSVHAWLAHRILQKGLLVATFLEYSADVLIERCDLQWYALSEH
jgi:hypothetical protein